MKQLYVHIGPFKTGTTAIQEYFWRHRSRYAAEGLLYPKTGITRGQWGHRHFHLASEFNERRWGALVSEVERSGCDKVLISSERFSQKAGILAQARPLLAPYSPRMIVFVRDERELVRSMYLQVVKGRFGTRDRSEHHSLGTFPAWWEPNKWRYVYARMIRGWAESYGADSIDYVPYRNGPDGDAISDICRVVGVPGFERPRRMNNNASIGGFAARLSVAASRLGADAAHHALRVGTYLERKLPALSAMPVRGFDPERVRAYYREANKAAASEFPAFGRLYASLDLPEPGGTAGPAGTGS